MESDEAQQDKVPDRQSQPHARKPLSPEVEDHMRMAARMLYDIIREWRERHPVHMEQDEKKSQADSD